MRNFTVFFFFCHFFLYLTGLEADASRHNGGPAESPLKLQTTLVGYRVVYREAPVSFRSQMPILAQAQCECAILPIFFSFIVGHLRPRL